MAEYFGIVARSESGSTAAMELISGRQKAAERASELLESGHQVYLYACKSVNFQVVTSMTIHIEGE